MKQAQQMQERLQKQMAELRVEGNAGGGMVTVVVNGAKQVQSLTIDPEVVSKDDVEMLQDLIVAAINDAHRKADEAMAQKMGGMLRRHEAPRHVALSLPDPLTRLIEELQRLPGIGAEGRAAARVPPAQDAARADRPADRRAPRRQGARHLLLGLQQHHRRRSLRLLHQRRAAIRTSSASSKSRRT